MEIVACSEVSLNILTVAVVKVSSSADKDSTDGIEQGRRRIEEMFKCLHNLIMLGKGYC